MRVKYLFIFIFFSGIWAQGQYDAQKFAQLYHYATNMQLFADQLFTLAAFNTYDPYNEKLQKKYLQVDEDWNFFNTYLQKNNLSHNDWEQLELIKNKLHIDLEHLTNELLFYCNIKNSSLSALKKIQKINHKVSLALLSSIMKKLYEKPPVRIENEVSLIEKASKLLYKTDKHFMPKTPENKLIIKMKADMNTFYMAFNNHYDPKILFGTYLRFTDKIRELNNLMFLNLKK